MAHNPYLLRSDGTERPALTWLAFYISTTEGGSACDPSSLTYVTGEVACAVYPNPTCNGIFTINNTSRIKTIRITDCTGCTIKEYSINDQVSVEVNLEAKQGIYLIFLTDGQHSTIRKIILI
ncbi:MAG: T9SS type A sorting domain-containing protein [Bacteroidales bacterium]|nr:T9SS type A sorting domain-containing protein [Bacteroidales bacterium]